MPDLLLFDLRFGEWIFDLKVERCDGETSVTVMRGPTERIVRRSIIEGHVGCHTARAYKVRAAPSPRSIRQFLLRARQAADVFG